MNAADNMTPEAAVVAAAGSLGEPGWELRAVSNYGSSQTYNNGRPEGLSRPGDADGAAGQWLIEFYKNTPTPTSAPDGSPAQQFPIRLIAVGQGPPSALPTKVMGVSSNQHVFPLPANWATTLAAIRGRAVAKHPKDRFSTNVFCDPTSTDVNGCVWLIKFYSDSNQIAAQVFGSVADGTEVARPAWMGPTPDP